MKTYTESEIIGAMQIALLTASEHPEDTGVALAKYVYTLGEQLGDVSLAARVAEPLARITSTVAKDPIVREAMKRNADKLGKYIGNDRTDI